MMFLVKEKYIRQRMKTAGVLTWEENTMEKAKVYFTDFHTVAFGDGLPAKLKKLIRTAGIGQIDMDGKFAAIKMCIRDRSIWTRLRVARGSRQKKTAAFSGCL